VHVALYQPQIPGNTGAIGRLCVGLDATLHIIGPCAFDFSAKALRRAGLDYWPNLRWERYAGPDDFLAWLGDRSPWLVSKHGRTRFDLAGYGADDVLIFGNEVRGLPAAWHRRWGERIVHIPVIGPVRSFNLANVVAVVLTQAKLKTGAFADFKPPPLVEVGG
jgi:tRNA (cytidine/uridine-2'-O-)-methyltransferase